MQVNNAEICRGIMLAENTVINEIDIKNYYGYVPAFLAAKIAIGQRISPFLNTEGISKIVQLNPVITFLQACQDENNPKDHKVQRSADLWTQTCLADYILRALGDGSEMASSVEGRPPFLDHEVFSWLRSQPVATRLSPGIDKKILRSAVADLLPQSVLLKNKQPFLAPPITRYGDKYTQTFIMDTLSCKSAQSLPFVDISRVVKWANTLPDKPIIEQQSAEPALMLILSAIFLQQAYGLTI
jgi:asparagine synthase (glutamine-hydrolysing)